MTGTSTGSKGAVRLFVDTSALIALADRSDQYHASADRFLRGLEDGSKLHTSNYILDETLTRLRFTAGLAAALKFAGLAYRPGTFQIHYVDAFIDQEALRILSRYRDKKLSHTDATTVVFLKRLGLQQIFSFDADFRTLGLEVLP